MSFLELRVSFSSNFTSLFSVMRDNSSVIFHLKLYLFWTKGANQSANFQIPFAILQETSQFSFKFCITLQCHNTKLFWNFLAETLHALDKPIKVQFFRLLSALMKVHRIPHAFFENTRSGYSNLPTLSSVMKDNYSVFFNSNFIYFGQKELIEVKFSDFWVVGWKFTKLFMPYLKPKVSFPLNFASLFSVTRDNSSDLFSWNFI